MLNYFKSKDISVYPSSLRAGTEQEVQEIFNPESRIATEDNINSRINAITTDRCFLISYTATSKPKLDADSTIKVCMAGYVFEIGSLKNVALANLYLKVKVKNFTAVKNNVDYNLPSLINQETGSDKAALDYGGTVGDEDSWEFRGLSWQNNANKSADEYILHLTDNSGNILPTAFGRINASDIFVDSNDSKLLSEFFDGQGLKFDVDAKWWGQPFSNDIKGDLTNAGNIIPETNKTKNLGDVNHYWDKLFVNRIITSNNPDGNIGMFNKEVQTGVYASQNIYLAGGVPTAGQTIYNGKAAPSNSLGNVGDIYIQWQD